jgi:serpin B
MNKRLFTVLILVTLLSLLGCKPMVSAPSGVLMSQKERITAPESSEMDLDQLVAGNNDFVFDLYRTLSSTEGNLFFSPYSISSALSMAYAGARGETEEQMANTLRYRLPQESLHPAFNALDIQLNQRDDEEDNGFQLNIVNAIWGQKDYSFLQSYLDLLAENYGAGLRITDFAEEPEESRITINDWVSQQTEDKINDLIPLGMINNATRLVLTNAIYFDAEWEDPFDNRKTYDGTFYLLNGDNVTVPMMTRKGGYGYVGSPFSVDKQKRTAAYTGGEEGYLAVELPYKGGEISMLIIMPNPGRFNEIESILDADMVNDIVSNIRGESMLLWLPKFDFESGFNLKDSLIELGMIDAFTDADFSGMAGKRDLFISDVIHKAFVSVDEQGTEAAAATAVVMEMLSGPPPSLTLNHPFIFMIRDIPTNTILFIGRVMNPAD